MNTKCNSQYYENEALHYSNFSAALFILVFPIVQPGPYARENKKHT